MKKNNIILFIIGLSALLIIIIAINIAIKKYEKESLPVSTTTRIKKEKPAERRAPLEQKKALEFREEELENGPLINPREPLVN